MTGTAQVYEGSKQNHLTGIVIPIPQPAAPEFVAAEVGNVDASTVVITFSEAVKLDTTP